MTRPDAEPLGGPSVASGLGSDEQVGVPDGIIQLSRSSCEGSLASLTRSLANTMSSRLVTVLDLRLDWTLAEIGKKLNVTRERVRQLETKANNLFLPLVRDWAAPFEQRWRDHLRTFATSEEELFAELRDPSFAAEPQNRAGRLALTTLIPEARYFPGFSSMRVKGWWAIDTIRSHRTLRAIGASGPLTDPELQAVLANLGVPPSFPTRDVLRQPHSPLRFHSGASAWVRSRASHRDAAVAMLRQRGEPMTSLDLAKGLGLNLKALNANLVRDHRVRQTRPTGVWTLVDWIASDDLSSGFHSTVEAVIAVLREHGPMKRKQLIHKVTAVYPVSSWAVLNALESRDIGQWESGMWDLVERGAPPLAPKPPPPRPVTVAESSDGRALTFYRAVDGEVLRGSGLAIGLYVGWRVGLKRPGDKRTFFSDRYPPLVVRRSFGSCNVSTLRLQVTQLGGRSGDVLALVLSLVSDQYDVHLLSGGPMTPAKATQNSQGD